MMPRHPRLFPSHYLPMLALFILLFVSNAFLVSPYIAWYDSGELIGNTVCLGISHPSGQVLLHILGKCFLILPWGSVPYKVGLMSAFCAALASAIFYDLARRLVTRLMPPDLLRNDLSTSLKVWLFLLTLGWSWSQPWWRYSLTPLVYALHLLLAMLLLWSLSLKEQWKWYLAFFILGVGTVLRPTQFFVLPFMMLGLLWEFRKDLSKLPKLAIFFTAFFIIGRSTGLYLPLRSALHPAMAYGDITHLNAFFHQVFALRFSKYVGTITLANMLSVFHQMLTHFFVDLALFGSGLVLWGIGFLWWEREKIPVFLWVGLGWGLAEAAFVFTIPYPTFESHQTILIWVFSGFLAAMPLALADQTIRKGQYKTLMFGLNLVMVVFVLAQLSMMGHLIERRNDRSAQDYARNALTLMAPNALFLPYEENEYFPVAGYQQAFNFRKDVEVVEPGTKQEVMGKRVEECLKQNRPIYVTYQWALPKGWAFESVGPLWRVVLSAPLKGKKPTTTNAEVTWGKIKLLSVQIEPPQAKAGDFVVVTYHWERDGQSQYDNTSSALALFTDEKGNYTTREGLFWFHDIHQPFGADFQALTPGLEYVEKRIVMIPSDYPTGRYYLEVALQKKISQTTAVEKFDKEFYERNTFQSLDKFQGQGENGSVVQFASGSTDKADNLWPVSTSGRPIVNSRFVPVAFLDIQTSDKP